MLNIFVWWASPTKKLYLKPSWWAMPTLQLIALLMCCITASCSMLIPGPGLAEFPLSDSSFLTSPMILQQKIIVSYGEKKIALIGIAELDKENIKIVGLTDFGKRLLMIDYDGQTIKGEIEPMLSEYFSGRDILLHYQMAYWPEATLSKSLSMSEWNMISSPKAREFVYQGDIIYRADIDKVLPHGADAKVCNLAARYCLKFENLASDE